MKAAGTHSLPLFAFRQRFSGSSVAADARRNPVVTDFRPVVSPPSDFSSAQRGQMPKKERLAAAARARGGDYFWPFKCPVESSASRAAKRPAEIYTLNTVIQTKEVLKS